MSEQSESSDRRCRKGKLSRFPPLSARPDQNQPPSFRRISVGTREWCDHWKQCVWFSKRKGLYVYKDGDVCMDATHTATSISYEFKAQSQKSEIDHLEFSTQDSHIDLSPERIAIYGDSHWRLTILKALNAILQTKESLLCVIADDSIFLTIAIAHLSKTSHIISLFPGQKKVDLLIAEPFYFGAEGLLPWHNLGEMSELTGTEMR